MASLDPSMLALGAALTFATALLGVALSAPIGAALAYYARPGFRYWAVLAMMFVPFALGNSVWAYLAASLAAHTNLQTELVEGSAFGRTLAVLLSSICRSLPLAVFFCGTALQRRTAEFRPYLRSHQLGLPFFLECYLNRIQRSTLMVVGLFCGSLMATDSSLPTFLYRANPGSPPESVGIMLARMFRETYASLGPEALATVSNAGFQSSLLLLVSALLGAIVGTGVVKLLAAALHRASPEGVVANLSAVVATIGIALCLLSPILCLLGLALTVGTIDFAEAEFFGALTKYRSIVALGIVVAAILIVASTGLAVALRYGKKDSLTALERSSLAAAVLFLPAFVPALSLIALIDYTSAGYGDRANAYGLLLGSHIALHFPVFQFICLTFIANVPQPHVSWQRAVRMRYSFSLVTDGFRRHAVPLCSLIGLCTILVVTDGSVSRWFSSIVAAPEEALIAAVFGRRPSMTEAATIVAVVGVIAVCISSILAFTYARDLAGRNRHA